MKKKGRRNSAGSEARCSDHVIMTGEIKVWEQESKELDHHLKCLLGFTLNLLVGNEGRLQETKGTMKANKVSRMFWRKAKSVNKAALSECQPWITLFFCSFTLSQLRCFNLGHYRRQTGELTIVMPKVSFWVVDSLQLSLSSSTLCSEPQMKLFFFNLLKFKWIQRRRIISWRQINLPSSKNISSSKGLIFGELYFSFFPPSTSSVLRVLITVRLSLKRLPECTNYKALYSGVTGTKSSGFNFFHFSMMFL